MEIKYPNYYEIDKSIAGIACRNEVERQSLLNMLRDRDRQAIVEFEWTNRNGVLFHREFRKDLPYINTNSLTFHNIPHIQGAKELAVKVYFDSKIMCFMRYRINEGEVW
ncbi:hypothetical protein [Butyrivibrio sp. INlla16]|uniref:hypothetical protein n=1 Tax=Butyrivibrio sp. INlla16 TaxID=1520807 RepID=UPI00088E95C7|nr:hypothetical protein [Butyrivibrio sp. INlla16]SDB66285.1 hypothetical protein SAMN02910263_03824 [Butyrivibrio sp. INlla16]